MWVYANLHNSSNLNVRKILHKLKMKWLHEIPVTWLTNDKQFSRCRNHDVICFVSKLHLKYKSEGQVVFYKLMT